MNNWDNLRTKIFNIGLIFCVSASLGFSEKSSRWERVWGHIPESQTTKIYADQSRPGGFWVAAKHAFYRLNPHSQTSEQSLNKIVFDFKQDPANPQEAYAVTKDGIEFYSSNDSWKNVLLRRGCRALAFADNKLFVATDEGLLVREADRGRWVALSGKLAHQPFVRLTSYGNVVYAVTPNALYRYDAASDDYKEIFSTGAAREHQGEEAPEDPDHPPLMQEILDVDAPELGEVYLSTRRGIFHTQNDGLTWDTLPAFGFSFYEMNALSVDAQDQSVWAATNEGVFRLENKKWVKKYRGLSTNEIFDVALDNSGNVYVGTGRGYFTYKKETVQLAGPPMGNPSKLFGRYGDVEAHFNNEPTIDQVQSMAVEYADVHPDKIKRWHRQSRLKAWLPSVSTGLDRSSTEVLHWDTGSNPDVLTKGRDLLDWDVGLSWDFADLVWSSDQTSIDSRSKLMTELREEILDQVTRIYFERRRAQLALLSDEMQGDVIEEEMRLAELTAILDGYTGGKFSRKIQ